MIIFFLPALAVILLYLLDVGWARSPRGHEGEKSQLGLPLDPSHADPQQTLDAELHSRASS